MKVSFLGCGAMGGAIASALAKSNIIEKKDIFVTAKHAEKASAFAKEHGLSAVPSNEEAAKDAEVIFLAVKPAFIADILDEIKASLKNDAVIVSMAAGISTETISKKLGSDFRSVIRIMPNMPAAIGQAMTALSAGENCPPSAVESAKKLLAPSGIVEEVPERLMDCVTAVSGSGPAFVFMFIEAMADAAVRCGMPRAQAYIYAAQTVKGSAQMALDSGKSPAQLKDSVCSPAGTTIEGVAALERLGMRSAVIEAVTAACEKSKALGKR